MIRLFNVTRCNYSRFHAISAVEIQELYEAISSINCINKNKTLMMYSGNMLITFYLG